MEIKVLYGDPQQEALLSEVALTEAASFRGFDTVGRSDIQSLLGLERQRQLLGCSEDAACLAEIGGALGVDYLLVGSVGRIGALLRLDLKLVEARKARVVGRVGTSLDQQAEKLVEATQNGVRALLHELSPAEPVARPSGPSRWPAWVAIGAGGAALAAGLGSAALSASEYRSLKAARADVGYAASYDARAAKVRRYALLADVLAPAGAVTLGAGGWLWWRSRPAAPLTVQVAATPGGGALLFSGAF
jgi:TolB-like protein